MREFVGSKFDKSLTTTEIAKCIRADIKSAVTGSELPEAKYSVKTKYFSGGSSIDIYVREAPFKILNPEYFATQDNYRIQRYNEEARSLLQKLEAIMRPYNRDNSDISTDYFDVRFYGHVQFDSSLEHGEYLDIQAKLKLCA